MFSLVILSKKERMVFVQNPCKILQAHHLLFAIILFTESTSQIQQLWEPMQSHSDGQAIINWTFFSLNTDYHCEIDYYIVQIVCGSRIGIWLKFIGKLNYTKVFFLVSNFGT